MKSRIIVFFLAYGSLNEGSLYCTSFLPLSSVHKSVSRKKHHYGKHNCDQQSDGRRGVRTSYFDNNSTFQLGAQTNSEDLHKDGLKSSGGGSIDTPSSSKLTSIPSSETENDVLKSSNQIPLLLANSKCVPNQMSPTSLAYIGDVVYEMCIRCRYVWPTRRTSDLQNVVVAKVRAETQSILFLKIQSSFPLTKEEQVIISRGRNAGSPKKKSRGPKRLYGTNNSKNNNGSSSGGKGVGGNGSSSGINSKMVGNQGPAAYQDSTALEALIGYLYLSDGDRCNELLEFMCGILDEMDREEGIP